MPKAAAFFYAVPETEITLPLKMWILPSTKLWQPGAGQGSFEEHVLLSAMLPSLLDSA